MQRNVTGYLQIHCRKLIDNNNVAGDLQTLNGAGTAGGISPKILCAEQAVAKGIYGASGNLIGRFGLTCIENPGFAGRWSNVIDWPLIPIHAVVTPTGSVMTFGSNLTGEQGAQFHYDVWDPQAGTSAQSHVTLDNTLGVDSFCSAAMVIPDNGNILMSGGDNRPNQRVNSGIADAPIFNTATNTLSRAANMNYERWYPTATTLPDGDIMLIGGINGARQHSVTPEVYSPQTDEWRSLLGISTAGYNFMYPRQWVIGGGRIFGVNDNRMYYLTTEGAGSLTAAGTLPNVALGPSSTAVMYAPGKVLQVAGYGSEGNGAITIDVNGAEPVVRVVESMAQPREFWSNSLVLPDGTVLVLGGSQINNNLPTAATGAELWDPATERWTQLSRSQLARLYHSTSVLLQDGTVLLAGGGAPGPLINRNAEVFSPPYLYDENGALKTRPEITIAPDYAAYGQTIALGISAEPVARVTLIKTSSVTHSWNSEQRFIELAFTASDGRIDVTLPANANLATPGYYMLFVLDESGTPSVAHMLKMGSEPAPEIIIEPSPALPPTDTPDNLLQNGGFELAKTSWNDCADASLTSAATDTSDGVGAIGITTGGCLYQEVPVTPGIEYTYSCDAAIGAAGYASVFLQISNSSYAELALDEQQIFGNEYTAYTGTIVAPANAAFASLGMYSEGAARYDSCALVAGNQPAPEPPPEPP
ncbi:MAG: galactose oxidase-like domain-containing protein, partial [Pseudomonadota bacterium]